MIKAPEQDKRKAATRMIAEALAQATPITAGLARFYQFTHPTEMEGLVDVWRRDVSATLNDHDAALRRLEDLIRPRMEVGEAALALAVWLTEQSEDGLRDPVMFDAIAEAFADDDTRVLEEACFELEHLGMVSCSTAMGHPVRSVRPDYALFWAFDPVVKRTDPRADAAQLAEMILEDDAYASVPKLHEILDWPKRRLNPAVACLIPLFPDGRVRKVIQPDYPTMGFVVTSEDRFQLKRFVTDFRAKMR
jgi:hypothetical protein